MILMKSTMIKGYGVNGVIVVAMKVKINRLNKKKSEKMV